MKHLENMGFVYCHFKRQFDKKNLQLLSKKAIQSIFNTKVNFKLCAKQRKREWNKLYASDRFQYKKCRSL